MDFLPQETEIVLALREGSQQAFEKIYQAYSPRLFGWVMKLVKSKPQTEEILQDVFLKLWEHRAAIDPEKSFRSFLFTIAGNKVYDFFRKVARDSERELRLMALASIEYAIIEEFKSGEEKLAILRKAIDGLPPQRQQVFRLCKLDEKSYSEVSELLGISVSTISDHIVKGTKAIRHYFRKTNPSLALFVIVLPTCVHPF